MIENTNKKGDFIFRPKARLIKTIGEELISSDNVAVVELVKNSYDANSPIVTITFLGNVKQKKQGRIIQNYLSKEGASIEIYDQGSGMSFETVKSAWMEPATDFKKKNTNKNRKFTGEKGIGRFASAKLASRLELITKQKEGKELVVTFNWEDFDKDDYLENIHIHWEEREPQEFKKENSGTLLRLKNLNTDWDTEKIRTLRTELSRLLNPIVPVEDFLIEIAIPDELNKDVNLNGIIERTELLNKPNYYIKGSITKEGYPKDFIYFSKEKGKEEQLLIETNKFIQSSMLKVPIMGEFSFEFRVWNRDRDNLRNLGREVDFKYGEVKKILDEQSGISIYRDGFRVLPYGTPNNDWVRLDIRRVNNPTLRLSNNQIVGYILISTEENPLLKDQSNREGIVEGEAFDDLKEYIKLILNEVEQRRYQERERFQTSDPNTDKNLFEKASLDTIIKTAKEKVPEQEELIKNLEQKNIELEKVITNAQEIISRYRRLSILGQLIDTIIHDGRGYLSKIDGRCYLILEELKEELLNKSEIEDNTNKIQKTRKDFSKLFERIEPFGGKRRGKITNIVIEELIRDQFLLYSREISNLKIQYSISESNHTMKIDKADFGIIFMNLIQNSIYWLANSDKARKIEVEVSDSSESIDIIFSDNGPGIKEGTEQSIFKPYFSTKPDGVGLGLTIVGELVSEYKGKLMLIDNGPLEGATFKIMFKK
ncbi:MULTISPECIES: ATP-binding protein [Capnocytophaga]|uniref:sensor histidine kinase n=1 Tax=Capnocytophaga TaxID=1016 RepID=UPI00020C5778|nr:MULTISPECIES: ATP-binding protein [unclassified Capnocytophaga]KHE69030.1 ATPase/histidine kinase/DNA gyrase B/HSP90 domain protein [Capnocytophaga sp. oral taxon 329 str. F0087]QGS18492.1 GHKL domain-containing protein [Capnocytophaga sp. FDAARGOS_737]